MLTVVELESEGQVVAVDGFRLKNLRDWLVPSGGDPLEVFGYAGSHCNVDCVFCYHKGDPPSLALGDDRRPAAETRHEMETRLKYFSPEAGSGIFPSLGNIYEVLAHRHILEVLKGLRQKTQRPFRITTNGRALTKELIDDLARVKPVYLSLSLHSASIAKRQELFNNRHVTDAAIEALPHLCAAQIPYAAVIVPWPAGSLSAMTDELEETASYVDAFSPHLIEVHLPGYSQYFSREMLFDREETWASVVDCIRRLREKLSTPVVIMPSMYEENLYETRKNLPRVVGLVKNSPAARSGLARGDLILAVNRISVTSRPQARDLLSMLPRTGQTTSTLVVRRGSQVLNLEMNLRDHAYPYGGDTTGHLGIVMMGTGLRASALERLKEIIDERKAKRVLFLTSTLMKPGFQQALSESPLFAARDLAIDLAIPRNRFFGGNIIMGDLMVVQDFIDCVEEYIASGNTRPDLIVMPSSPFNLGRYKRDLSGRVYLDVERQVGIPVALLDCDTIYD